MSFLEHFNALHPHIKDYVYFQWSVREEMNGKDIIGWNCMSSSVVRKDETLSRVKEAISTLELPLVVEDDNERSCHFKILLDKVKLSYEGEPFSDDSRSFNQFK
jgi:hypothetical protein